MRASVEDRTEEAERLIGAALPAGWPDPELRPVFEAWLAVIARKPDTALWFGRAMIRLSNGAYIGNIGFHGRPDADGRVEMGYEVESPYHRQGYATEAARALMDWARTQHGVRRFMLSIAPANVASLGMAAKLGFRRTGTRIDEVDDEEGVFELG